MLTAHMRYKTHQIFKAMVWIRPLKGEKMKDHERISYKFHIRLSLHLLGCMESSVLDLVRIMVSFHRFHVKSLLIGLLLRI